jgi:hypothetical protein
VIAQLRAITKAQNEAEAAEKAKKANETGKE